MSTETAAPLAALLVIHPHGVIDIEPHEPRGIPAQAAEHVPDIASHGHGALRLWYADRRTADTAPNPLAAVFTHGLGLPCAWRGPLAISAEPTGAEDWPPLPSAALWSVLAAVLGLEAPHAIDAVPVLAELAHRAAARGY